MTCLLNIVGKYKIINHSNTYTEANTDDELIAIMHMRDKRFAIASIDGPTRNWSGLFTVDNDGVSGEGDYKYMEKDYFGKHNFQFDCANSQIRVEGVSSKPIQNKSFWLVLKRES